MLTIQPSDLFSINWKNRRNKANLWFKNHTHHDSGCHFCDSRERGILDVINLDWTSIKLLAKAGKLKY